MLLQSSQSKAKNQPLSSDPFRDLSTAFPVMPAPAPLQITDLWQRYRRGGMPDSELLQGLSKQIAELEVPPPLRPGKFQMATQLAYAPCATKLQTADAIEALVAWADDHGIQLIDGAAA